MSSPGQERWANAVAVIGMACRLPGAQSPEELWSNLAGGVESIRCFAGAELTAAGVPAAAQADPAFVAAHGVLDGVDLFDAGFFDFNRREAELTDPQHRLLLELAWEALERGGYGVTHQDGRAGVFVGSGQSGYLDSVARSERALGDFPDFLATRLSYKLNLRGLSLTVQTACSTSLVAVHLACKSLLDGECDLALAGGVSIRLPQVRGYRYEDGGVLSADGHCRAFDAGATGTVGGNGLGLVLLKRMTEALADGDPIHALLLGSAANNDGADKLGYTAPGVGAQTEVIAEALAMARVGAGDVGYVEAHGTGTPLGDPIEVAALTQAFRETTDRSGFCALGSVKTNLGHLDAAAGVVGLIKAVLALEHRQLPPSLHFAIPNPKIDFASTPFYVNSRLTPWPAADHPRRAGVSSFGMGGTNVHVVLEEAPPPAPGEPGDGPCLLLLSARSAAALKASRRRLAAHLEAHPEVELADVGYTAAVGRRVFEHRWAAVCAGTRDAVAALREEASASWSLAHAGKVDSRTVVFLFPGQGTQRPGIGRELYGSEAVFRDEIDRCAELLRAPLGCDLRELLFPAPSAAADAARRLSETAYAQPALLAVEVALARLWMSWGVRPAAMIGHSLGEYAAACLAGVLSLEDALALVAARGDLMQRLPEGAMLEVALGELELAERLGPELSLAAVNGPQRAVVSGPVAAIEALASDLRKSGVACQRLATSRAFHSAMMDPAVAPFVRRVRDCELHAPTVSYVSNLTGRWITAEEATDPEHWGRHLRHTVRFAEGVSQLAAEPGRVYLEVGPGRLLWGYVRALLGGDPVSVIRTLPDPRGAVSECAFLRQGLGRLWLAGVGIEGAAGWAGQRRRRVVLPTYPFERQRYWLATAPAAAVATVPEPATPSAVPAVPASTSGDDGPDEIEQVLEAQLKLLSRHLEILEQCQGQAPRPLPSNPTVRAPIDV